MLLFDHFFSLAKPDPTIIYLMDQSASFFRSKTDGDLAFVCWGHHHFAKITNARQLRAMPAIVGLLINSGFTHFTNFILFSRSLALMARSPSHSWPKERGPSSAASPATPGAADISADFSTGELWREKKAAQQQADKPIWHPIDHIYSLDKFWSSELPIFVMRYASIFLSQVIIISNTSKRFLKARRDYLRDPRIEAEQDFWAPIALWLQYEIVWIYFLTLEMSTYQLP